MTDYARFTNTGTDLVLLVSREAGRFTIASRNGSGEAILSGDREELINLLRLVGGAAEYIEAPRLRQQREKLAQERRKRKRKR